MSKGKMEAYAIFIINKKKYSKIINKTQKTDIKLKKLILKKIIIWNNMKVEIYY